MKQFVYTLLLSLSSFAFANTPVEHGFDSFREDHRVVLTARHRTVLSSQVSSVVTEIKKQMGEKFKEGDVLLQLDDVVFYSEETKALATLERAKVRLEATERLFKDDASSLLELKEAQMDAAAAESELVHATKTLTACAIKAPYDGEIVDVFTDLHEMVQPGEELVEVIESSVLIGKILLPSDELPYVKNGIELDVEIQELGVVVKAKVSNVGAVIDPVSSMVKVYVEIENSEGLLKPGMIGKTRIRKA
ncbi:MAG: efflux RND transporter periplasmic adaptor subunit [Chlamydiales bacterium]|nr:efflux RND transporter periplasmic adaptor subunit [Chlamydiales bacterium]NCF70237.1 efflux RND transporter periplasmic adaptor subunit [Chlamydiales bacterium]